MKTLNVDFGNRSYGIYIGKDLLKDAGKLLNLDRKVFILTDRGVPAEYAERIKKESRCGTVFTVNVGEGSKSFSELESVLSAMLSFGMSRTDALVAVGGGVVGDLGGLCASLYMRGIDFYNIPTTLLAQVDSSIGGKCAINLSGVKNTVGSFYQPKAVIVDTDTLKTLTKRHISEGLAESIKMAATSDASLFSLLENEEIDENIYEEIIIRSLTIKKSVVEADEREGGIRKILNFGHTLGHGIEAELCSLGIYHGECVALGMIPMCQGVTRERLIKVLKKANLPVEMEYNLDKALSHVVHDKKCSDGLIDAVFVDVIGKAEIKKLSLSDFENTIRTRLAEI